ncbi:antibiotic biosynthesis monooxygenase [Acetobacteraceae bacterium KSS8]|uniref:Antibiotic biosynthesis monooxygenase n=1 Tax=Endosaccharibacter trunci TaxID=2812733 RepID=A0ABT1W5Z2_9PROT|nr:antibiotic biosynthesis monooxygenase [Acetobacteraceae bacterium KSS8]
MSATETTTDALVIWAEFTVPAEKKAEFLRECAADARDSVANEPGCSQFDVLVDENGADTVTLFEIYKDAAAFETHLTMPHYATFAAALARLGIAPPNVRRLLRAHKGGN